MAVKGEGFGKKDRLLDRREFLRVQRRGAKTQTKHLIGLELGAEDDRRRLGLVVSSKVGNAVCRNQVKRWLREIFRKDRELLPLGVDLVIVAKQGADRASQDTLRCEFREIAKNVMGQGKKTWKTESPVPRKNP